MSGIQGMLIMQLIRWNRKSIIAYKLSEFESNGAQASQACFLSDGFNADSSQGL